MRKYDSAYNYNRSYDYNKYYKEHKALSLTIGALELCAGLTVASGAHKVFRGIFKNNGLLKHIGIPVLDFVVLDRTMDIIDECFSSFVRADMRYEERKEQEEAEANGEPADGSEV